MELLNLHLPEAGHVDKVFFVAGKDLLNHLLIGPSGFQSGAVEADLFTRDGIPITLFDQLSFQAVFYQD